MFLIAPASSFSLESAEFLELLFCTELRMPEKWSFHMCPIFSAPLTPPAVVASGGELFNFLTSFQNDAGSWDAWQIYPPILSL